MLNRLSGWLRTRGNTRSGASHPLAHVALMPPFDTMVPPLPPGAIVPSVMSETERRFLYGLARDYYTGVGCILDAGIFLGASTVAFGAGLRANPRFAEIISKRPKPIIAIEKAVVTPTMMRHFKRHGIGEGLEPGMSFAPLLQRSITPVADLVDLRIGDITKIGVVDSPIEILFLDVLKRAAIGLFAVENYFTRLIPGRSIVVQQDYFFDSLEFIKVHQEFFADHFDQIGEIASSALFRCRAEVTPADLKRFAGVLRDPAAQIALATAAIARTADPARRLLMAISKHRLVTSLLGVSAARDYCAEIEREFASVLRAPDAPVRVRNAMRAARFLSESKGDRKALSQAQRIAFGLSDIDGS